MPVKECQIGDKSGYKWGDEGKCYTGPNAKEDAIKQGVAIGEFSGLKISFDYDETLSTVKGKELAKSKIDEGNDVYIITARNESGNNDGLFNVAKDLGILKDRIYFTNGKDKFEIIKRLGIDMHYDNNQEQIDKINKSTKSKGIKFSTPYELFLKLKSKYDNRRIK